MPIEKTFLTAVVKTEILEVSTAPSNNSGNCECLEPGPCFNLLKNCIDTATEDYEKGNSSEELYVIFTLKLCPNAFVDCVEMLYGLE